MWKKICAFCGGLLAAALGIFSFILERKKRKQTEEKLKENERKLKETEEILEKEKEKEKRYADYKKENESLIADAVSGDADAALNILHNASEAGKKRNSRN